MSDKNHDGPHVMSQWAPKDRNTKYRYCLVQWCNHIEEKEVKG